MPTANPTLIKTENLGLKFIKHLLFWPLWWFSGGFLVVLKISGERILSAWKGLAIGVWLKNILRPMYGQYDPASRIISFIMRVVQIIFRLIIFVIIAAFIMVLPAFYLGLPILAVWQLLKY
jgi:hypothetical protein